MNRNNIIAVRETLLGLLAATLIGHPAEIDVKNCVVALDSEIDAAEPPPIIQQQPVVGTQEVIDGVAAIVAPILHELSGTVQGIVSTLAEARAASVATGALLAGDGGSVVVN